MNAAVLTLDFPAGHRVLDAHQSHARRGTTSPETSTVPIPIEVTSRGTELPTAGAISDSLPKRGVPLLLDPLLLFASKAVDELEHQRITLENRYRMLTNHGESDDGHEWGFGLDDTDPNVALFGALVDQAKATEHQAVLHLNRLMRKHPLGPWVKEQRGMGEKTVARLLGVIGDPYWHTAEDRPRTVSELWAYCGLHTLPASHKHSDTHSGGAGGYNVAARRRKGQQANWSDDAKKRVWLIATSCIKAGGEWRKVYDDRRAKTADRVHGAECVRCGPSGNPAQPGTPWNPGHQHADALRILSKEILKGLYNEAKRIHQEG